MLLQVVVLVLAAAPGARVHQELEARFLCSALAPTPLELIENVPLRLAVPAHCADAGKFLELELRCKQRHCTGVIRRDGVRVATWAQNDKVIVVSNSDLRRAGSAAELALLLVHEDTIEVTDLSAERALQVVAKLNAEGAAASMLLRPGTSGSIHLGELAFAVSFKPLEAHRVVVGVDFEGLPHFSQSVEEGAVIDFDCAARRLPCTGVLRLGISPPPEDAPHPAATP